MDLQGLVEATNNKKTETEEKSVNGKDICVFSIYSKFYSSTKDAAKRAKQNIYRH